MLPSSQIRESEEGGRWFWQVGMLLYIMTCSIMTYIFSFNDLKKTKMTYILSICNRCSTSSLVIDCVQRDVQLSYSLWKFQACRKQILIGQAAAKGPKIFWIINYLWGVWSKLTVISLGTKSTLKAFVGWNLSGRKLQLCAMSIVHVEVGRVTESLPQ